MRFPSLSPSHLRFLALAVLGVSGLTVLTGCLGRINVMGRDIPDSEYRARYDKDIARERQHLEPDQKDEKGRIPSWDQFWCTAGGLTASPATAQSRRLKKYVVAQRRAAGLPELTNTGDWDPGSTLPDGPPGSYRPDHYYPSGDPRIFKW